MGLGDEIAAMSTETRLDETRTEEGSQVVVRTRLQWLSRTLPGKITAVLGFFVLLVAVLQGLVALRAYFAPADDQIATTIETLASLSLSEVPQPSAVTDVLGFGDSSGGRRTFAYTSVNDQPIVADEPTINALVGISNELPTGEDERAFMGVAALSTRRPRDGKLDKYVRVERADTPFVAVRVVLNNYGPEAACEAPSGEAVASGARLIARVWDSSDGRRHIIRTWITYYGGKATASDQSWITDAVEVVTRPDVRLQRVARSGLLRREKPEMAVTDFGASVAEAGGQLLGDGLLGSCWINREGANLVYSLVSVDTVSKVEAPK